MILSPKEQRMAIIRAVATLHHVYPEEVLSDCRHKAVARARYHAMALVRARFADPYQMMGRLFGRDHTSVMYGIARHFGYHRAHRVGLKDAGLTAEQGLQAHRAELLLEAERIIQAANLAKHIARANNPIYAGVRHAA